MQYPQQIIDEIDKYANNPIFYILEIESDTPTYKFGITIDIKTRIRTHCRTLNVKRIIKLLDCKYDSVMRSVETNFKRYAKSIGIMVTKFEQTEILITNDINKYIAYIEDKINWELLRPQPKNNRTAEKIKVCNPDIIPVAENNNIANNTLTCNKCGKEFSLEHHLNRHNARKTPCVRPENNFKCQKCNMCYSTKFNLTKHSKKCMKGRNAKQPVNTLEIQIRDVSEQIEHLKAENNKHNDKIDELEDMILYHKLNSL